MISLRMPLKRGLISAAIAAAALGPVPALAEPVALRPSSDGALLPVLIDQDEGKVLLTLPAPDSEGVLGRYLFTSAVKSGLGSAPIRIDRGMQGDTKLLAFRRMGKKVAVVFENPRFRASGDAAVQQGATASFPFSTMAMVDVVSETSGGGVTVDLTPFLLADTMNLADALNAGAKGFKLSDRLSAANVSATKVFPRNVEMETVHTYVSDTPGRELATIAPDARQVSFTLRHSLVALPEPDFEPRKFDIRSGTHATQVYDFSTPLGEPVLVEYANRFRLEKTDPSAARSPVKKPIVFYIDSAAPEPVRSALADGVRWWADAFDAAGLVDAFRVETLPPGVDPQDVRYNVVNWADRQNRSWSYGGGVIDPRTGEIIKGNVVLGALRIRQDIAIFEGLVGTAQNNTGGPNDPVRAALARIRQLGAHEVGHAIGFVHNFAASLQDRASVMDYPGPLVEVKGGQLDLGNAYAVGIGDWDKYTVDWLYGQPAPGVDADEAAERKAEQAVANGLVFGTDVDGRAADLGVPGVNMWTEGQDEPEDLAHTMEVRRIALANFGPQVLNEGEPLSELRRKFVPIWLFHRYSVDATGKLIGGVNYGYAVAGDGTPLPSPVSAGEQLEAIDALLGTLSADILTVPAPLALTLSSGTSARFNAQDEGEIFDTAGAAVFDPLVAADVAAQVTLDSLLAPKRLTRLHVQHALDPALPGLSALLQRLDAAVITQNSSAVARRVAQRAILTLAATQRDPETPIDVAAALSGYLASLSTRMMNTSGSGDAAVWQRAVAALLNDPQRLAQEIDQDSRAEPIIPPGMPIGGDTGWFD